MNYGERTHAEISDAKVKPTCGNLRFEQPQIFQVRLIDVVEADVYSTNALEGALPGTISCGSICVESYCEFVPGEDEVVPKPFVSSGK